MGVVTCCPTKFLILARTSVLYVAMSVNYENQDLIRYCRQLCKSNYGFFVRRNTRKNDSRMS